MLYAPEIDPVIFSLGPLELHWYGLMYLAAAAAFWSLGRYRARDVWRGVNVRMVDDLVFYGLLGAIIGGRLGYVLFYMDWEYIRQYPLAPFAVWQGGMSFHGGVAGVMVAVWFIARRNKMPVLQVSDFIAPLIPLGLGFGRVGNFINGELWGRASDVPWAMVFRHVDSQPRHPSQLYEALCEGLLLFIFLYVLSQRPRRLGVVSAWFALGYAACRFAIEFVREPDAQLGFIAWGWLTMGHALTLALAFVGLVLLIWSRRTNVLH